MSQPTQQRITPRSPTFAITPKGAPIKISSRRGVWTVNLFGAITMGAVIGVPLYGYLYHYTWFDWSMFGLLYVVSGLGITVRYHRLMSHRSFDCPNWDSVCHLWGQQPHGTSDSSRDSWLVSLVTFGEGYHNYHHMYPTDYRNGTCWYHFELARTS